MSLACDSQKAVNTSTPRAAAIAVTSRTRRLLPMPGEPTTPTTPPCPSMARSNKPSTAAISQRRPTRFDSARPAARCPSRQAQQPTGGHRFLGTLDPNQLQLTQTRRALHQSRRRRAEHHPTRRGHRLHPLGHPDLLTHGGVAKLARTHFTGDHLTGVQPDPQPQIDTVALAAHRRQAASPPPEGPRPPDRPERRGPPTRLARRTPP